LKPNVPESLPLENNDIRSSDNNGVKARCGSGQMNGRL
jgi:hypothetical protein